MRFAYTSPFQLDPATSLILPLLFARSEAIISSAYDSLATTTMSTIEQQRGAQFPTDTAADEVGPDHSDGDLGQFMWQSEEFDGVTPSLRLIVDDFDKRLSEVMNDVWAMTNAGENVLLDETR